MSYGPNPWQQTQWDWRAAGNFMGGGAGSGLLVFTALSGAQGTAAMLLVLAGLALVGLGLLCVWLEIGRPLRALHVFFNPRTSWMTREGFVATLLFPAGLAAAAGVTGFVWITALLALAFVYCQGRILKAARGIPAWREPLVVPLIVSTGLAEGGGLFLLTHPLHGLANQALMAVFGALLAARWIAWIAYRRRLAPSAAPRALAALDRAGAALQGYGTWLAFALVAPAGIGLAGGTLAGLLAAAAGLLAAGAGLWLKYTLITRAAFNQGFALKNLPVRGVRA
ncbi:MAG: dimethyl sulfoxide reductase anchor subunit [Burkholderiaceae bacterium]|nr:dimethyl sulfoxide reductase anchor subunit [Burkholderiaceae bacterium]